MKIEKRKPTEEEKKMMKGWPTWEKEVSEFDWEYDEKETCYILEGLVEVDSPVGRVEFGAGDMMVFPKGLKCRWNVKEPVRKHYNFGD